MTTDNTFTTDNAFSTDPMVQYRYYQRNGLILDREQVMYIRDLRKGKSGQGALKVVLAHQVNPLWFHQPDEQAAFLAWYLQAPPTSSAATVPPREEKPYLRIGVFLLHRQCLPLLMESPIEGDDTLFLRSGLPFRMPLMSGKDLTEEGMETLELRGRSANALRHWLEEQVETVVPPIKHPAFLPPKDQEHLVMPTCPHCDCLLSPSWDRAQGTLHLNCMICGTRIGPLTPTQDIDL